MYVGVPTKMPVRVTSWAGGGTFRRDGGAASESRNAGKPDELRRAGGGVSEMPRADIFDIGVLARREGGGASAISMGLIVDSVELPRREGGGASLKSSAGMVGMDDIKRRELGGASKSLGGASDPESGGIPRRELGGGSKSLGGASSAESVGIPRRETGGASTSRARSETDPASMASRVNVEMPKSTSLTKGDPLASSDTMTLPGFRSR
jgi:hypothetical protein